MRRNAWIAILLSIGSVIASQVAVVPTAEASNNDAVLTGVVRPPEGRKGVDEAVVTVTSDKLQGERSVTTDKNGWYRIPDLPPGVYEVRAAYGEYTYVNRIVLRATITSRLDIRLKQVQEATEILVDAPVDTTQSNVGYSVDTQMARRVPIAAPTGKGGANRSFEAVAEATPGATNDLYGTSVAGTSSPENKYYVDGLSVSDPGFGLNGTALTVEFIQEVRVEVGGYMPEFGRATGGIINAVTKSGSNDFHGGVWVYYSPGQLEGYRKPPMRSGSTILAERQLYWLGDAGFDVGGRLIRDKLWFYGGVSFSRTSYDIKTTWNRVLVDEATGMPLTDASTGFNVTERIPSTEVHRKAQGTTVQALAKLTYTPSRNHTINLLGIYAPTLSGGNGTYGMDMTTGSPEVTSVLGTYNALSSRYRDESADVQLEWKARADNSRWDITTVLGWHHQINRALPNDGSRVGSTDGLAGTPGVIYRQNTPEFHSVTDFIDLPPGAPTDACDPWVDPTNGDMRTITCPANTFTTGGPGFIMERRLDRLQARSTVSRTFVAAGHHTLKFGVDFEYMSYNSNRAYTGGTLYRESTDGTSYNDYRRYGYLTGPDEERSLLNLNWNVYSTTIGGFLQDSWSIMDRVTLNAGVRYDAQHLFGGDGRMYIALPNQISPRLGLVWDPTQSGKAKLFVNYARFYQSIPLNLADRAGSGEPSIRRSYDGTNCDPANPDSEAKVCQSNASLMPIGGPTDTNRYWEGFGGKTAVDPALKPQSSDEFVAGGEYELIPGAKVGINYTHRWFHRVMEDMSRDEATTYFIGNPGYGIAKDFPKGRRIYDALIFHIDKRFGNNWLVSGSYTLAWLRGNIAGLFRPETGQLDPNSSSDFDLISLLANRFGPLPGDHRHTLKLFAAGEIPLGNGNTLMLGGAFRASSGGPTNLLASHQLYGAGEAFLVPRGDGERLPWVFRIDTNVGYRKYFTEDLTMDITMDVFNVANFQAATGVDQNYTLSDVVPIPGATVGDVEKQTDVNGAPIEKNPNFGNPTSFQSPRLFRFGVRLNF